MQSARKNNLSLDECLKKTEWYINGLAKYLAPMCTTPIEDLRQEGFLGAARARELYNPEISSFLTYAQYWIKTYMYALAYKNSFMMQIPEEFHFIYAKYKQRRKALESGDSDDVVGQIAEELNISESRLRKIIGVVESLKHNASLDNTEPTSAKLVVSVRPPEVDDSSAMLKILKKSVTPEEYFVIDHMLGLTCPESKTLSWVGKILGVTKERVRQIKNAGLKKFKKALEDAGHTDARRKF